MWWCTHAQVQAAWLVAHLARDNNGHLVDLGVVRPLVAMLAAGIPSDPGATSLAAASDIPPLAMRHFGSKGWASPECLPQRDGDVLFGGRHQFGGGAEQEHLGLQLLLGNQLVARRRWQHDALQPLEGNAVAAATAALLALAKDSPDIRLQIEAECTFQVRVRERERGALVTDFLHLLLCLNTNLKS